MSGLIELAHAGFGNSIQDAGRLGYRHMGITVSGYLDRYFARCANALVGNAPEDACIEIRAYGPTLQVQQGPVRVAVTGNMNFRIIRADGSEEEGMPWQSILLHEQDTLESVEVNGGVAYMAIGGGILTPMQLGSRSTYQRAQIGGIDGRLLANGDFLPCGLAAELESGERKGSPWEYANDPVRVILGPQEGHFKPESVREFLETEYKVTAQMDRMGMRLEGPALQHVAKEAADIVSDGITPGAIQVPGNGLPIVLLADCQTVGGYPKIATIILADLPRLAQLKPDQMIRFQAVNAVQARAALVEREDCWHAWEKTLTSIRLDDREEEGDDGSYCVAV